MEQKGIICGATIQLNFPCFGYDALATLLISVDAQQVEQVMEFIGKITEIRAYRQYNSVYNIRAVAILRNLNELDYIKQVIKRNLPTTGLKTYIWTGVKNIPDNLDLLGNLKPQGFNQTLTNSRTATENKEVTIDKLDREIISKLTLNGRATFTQIAKEIEVSTDTVVKRYHKLRERGAIKVCIQINPKKIGYTSIMDFNIAFTSQSSQSDTVVEALAKIPDIIIITRTSGDFDLQLTAMIRDVAESFNIQDAISRVSGVTKIEASARKIPEQWPTPQQYISTV
jgi:DNA-binding Lrp family transcriptional regulator